VSALAALLLAGARGVATLAPISIDPCVDVDAEEVRRLTDIELAASREASAEVLDVVVSCREGGQELRLTERASQRVTVRGIDLSASGTRDRDARARELALAIAELVRRSNQPTAAPVQYRAAPAPPPAQPPFRPAAPGVPWRTQLGASAVVDGWTGGQALYGAELAGRLHLGRWLIGELRLGGRKTGLLDLERGTMDGYALAGSAGVSLDATPYARRAGLAFGARLGIARLRYSVVGDDGVRLGAASASAVSANATASGFVAISGQVGLLVDASIGGALHTVVIQENNRSISALNGVLLSSAVGVAAQF